MKMSGLKRTFLFGIALLAQFAFVPVADAEIFSLAVIPDSQAEVLIENDPRLPNRLEWLVKQRAELNIAMVLHVGDLLNWDTPDHIQYERASRALKILDDAKLPYALTVGNHDTAATKEGGSAAPGNTNLNQRNTSTFNHYFPASRLKIAGQTFEENKVENGYRTFKAGGMNWLVINLELWARQAPIDWAKKIVHEHPDHNFILLTHAFLTNKGDIQQNNGGYGDNSPQYIFDNFVKQAPTARLVFCGHVGTHAYRKETGTAGNTIHMFNQTYHDKSNPVRIFQIDPEQNTIKTWVFCPQDGKNKDDGSTMTIEGVNWIKPMASSKGK